MFSRPNLLAVLIVASNSKFRIDVILPDVTSRSFLCVATCYDSVLLRDFHAEFKLQTTCIYDFFRDCFFKNAKT